MCNNVKCITNKLSPYGTDGRLLLTANFKVTWHKNSDKNKKSGPDKLSLLCPNIKIRGHLPAAIINGEEIAFENSRLCDFQGLVTLTLTLDRVILHTFLHQSSTSTYIPNVIEIEETFCGRTDVRTGGRTFDTHFIRLTRRSRPKDEES